MSRNDRVSIKFTDLPIESTFKVTKFLNDFLIEDWLGLDVFEEKINKYTLLEQYFIYLYSQDYYSKHRLKKWLNQTGNDRFDPELIGILYTNSENFVLNIEGKIKSLRRILADSKRKGKVYEKINVSFREKPLEFRFPLYFPPLLGDKSFSNKNYTDDVKHFKQYLRDLFQNMFSDEDVEHFIINSFKFKNNLYPIQLLYIEVDNITDFKNRMIELYNFYKDFYDAKRKRYRDYYDQSIENILNGKQRKKIIDVNGTVIETEDFVLDKDSSESRRKYYNGLKKKLELPEITKYDFTKILYNSFPHIREDYIKKMIDNPDYKLEDYIIKTARSIRKS